MKVGALLTAARTLLDEPAEEADGAWPHGVAVLARQAIEATMVHAYRARGAAMDDANWTERWLALPVVLGDAPEIADANLSWTVLSQACHHRGYDIGLTEPELRRHLEVARAFAILVADRTGPRSA